MKINLQASFISQLTQPFTSPLMIWGSLLIVMVVGCVQKEEVLDESSDLGRPAEMDMMLDMTLGEITHTLQPHQF